MKNDVTLTHSDYDKNIALWQKVDDVCSGQDAIKEKATEYLAKLDPNNFSNEENLRYLNYLARAVFYGFTTHTLKSNIGLAFKKWPKLEVPSVLDYVIEDVDGGGLSIYQQSQKVVSEVLKKGRTILYVDYPSVDPKSVSVADLEQGYIRPVILNIKADFVRYWETKRFGAKHKLSLVVIQEQDKSPRDGFGYDLIDQYRVLRFDGQFYTVEIWRKGQHDWELYQAPQIVLDGSGRPFNEIPLIFVGSENNNPDIDSSPLLELANLNLAHYENSASYEWSVFFCGMIQAWIGGLPEQWRDWLDKKGIKIGSSGVLLLPDGSTFNFAQAKPNTLAFEAMTDKKQQMLSMGARLSEQGTAIKTATQAQNEVDASTSVLSLIVNNVSDAYTKCLKWMLMFLNVSVDGVEYIINSDFSDNSFDAQKITALVAAYNAGLLPKADAFNQLRKYGLINPEKTDEDIKDELENDTGGMNV